MSKKTGLFSGLAVASETWQDSHKIVEAERWQVGLYGSGGTKIKHQISNTLELQW